jgi:hypothetical protein
MAMAAVDPKALGDELAVWLEHRFFDRRSALEHGPFLGDEQLPCGGTLYFSRAELRAGDSFVIVGCASCDYEVGVPRAVIAEHLDEVVQDGEGEERWYQR